MVIKQFQQAARSLLRRPSFTATVVATLAVGLGASAAIFNVTDAVLLRSIPFEEPESLFEVWETVERETVERRSFAYPDFADLREQATSFAHLAAFNDTFYTVLGAERAERVPGAMVSRDYFELLGTAPALGGGFSEDLAASEDGASQVVLSHEYWTSRMGADPQALGRTLTLNDVPLEVVGVMPEGFVPLVDGALLWTPFEQLPQRILENRDSRWHSVIGRLAEGVGEESARQELTVIFGRLEEAYPDSNLHYSADLGPLSDALVGDLRAPLLTLLAAVALVLLVACANVASLLRVHAARRAPDTALRHALGASPWAILRQNGAETLLLGVAGGTLGLAIAFGATRALERLSPIQLPAFVSFDIGARLIGFAAILAVLVGVMLALSSMLLRGRRPDTAGTLRTGTARLNSRLPGLTSLLVAQVALATVLAVGAGLLLLSFQKLQNVDPGFESERLAFARIGLPPEPPRPDDENDGNDEDDGVAEPSARSVMRARILEIAQSVPGVRRAALGTDSPLEGGFSATVVSGEDTPRRSDLPWDGAVRVYRHLVTPGYFDTTGITLLAGRDFEPTDRGESQGVAIVSQKLAGKLWPDQQALGQRFKFGTPIQPGSDTSEVEWVTVVGVVADHRHRSLIPDANRPPEDPDVYFAMDQFDPGNVAVAVSTEGPPTQVLSTFRRSLEQISPELTVYNVETISERLSTETARTRFASTLLAAFAGVTVFLSILGIYGLVAYQVEASLREIGIRLALGAGRGRVVRRVVEGAGRWLVVGTLVGLGAAVFAARLIRSQLYEVAPVEVGIYVGTGVLLVAAGVLAALVPSMRAGRVEPVEVLRSE